MRLGLTLQKWHRTSWRSLEPDLERGYGLWAVPRLPGSGAPPWQRVVQRQEAGRAEVDSGGGGAGYRGPLQVVPPHPVLPFGPLKPGCCCLVLTTGLDDWSVSFRRHTMLVTLAPCALSVLRGQSFGSLSSSGQLWHSPVHCEV